MAEFDETICAAASKKKRDFVSSFEKGKFIFFYQLEIERR